MDIILGTFNSEKFWRPENIASLPQTCNIEFDRVIAAFDEMQFVFCSSDDLLVTFYPFNDVLKDYLESIGICFSAFHTSDRSEAVQSVEGSLINNPASVNELSALLKERNSSVNNILPYSVLPATKELCGKLNVSYNNPEIECIVRVNSKVFSTEISNSLGLLSDSTIISSSLQLKEAGIRLLENGRFFIKDPFGVSGKGSFLIESLARLDKFYDVLRKQEDNGRLVQCVVEPVYKKVSDFSSIYSLKQNGEAELISVQKMSNYNNSYIGTTSLNNDELKILDKSHYYDNTENVLQCMHNNGYYGPVCIDSMIVENQEVIPLIEINARKSMSNIRSSLNQKLKSFDVSVDLTNYSLVIPKTFNYERFLKKLKENNLLFTGNQLNGIVPLSANSVIINHGKDGFKGKFYFGLVANKENGTVLNRLRQIFEMENVKVLN